MSFRNSKALPCFTFFILLFTSALAMADDSLCAYINKKGKASEGSLSWPVRNFIIANSINTIVRGIDYGDSFHTGLDLKTPQLEPVCLPLRAKITHLSSGVLSGAELMMLDEAGRNWSFAHLSPSSISDAVKDSLKNGTYLETGTFIGKVEFPEIPDFNHIHIGVGASDHTKSYHPLLFLEAFPDKISPEIMELSLHGPTDPSSSESKIKEGHLYTVALKTRDLISDFNHSYFVPPYKITFSLNGAPREVVSVFNETPPMLRETVPYDDQAGKYFISEKNCHQTYCKDFVIDLGFRIENDRYQSREFPTTAGKYEIEVFVEDFAGNVSSQKFRWEVVRSK